MKYILEETLAEKYILQEADTVDVGELTITHVDGDEELEPKTPGTTAELTSEEENPDDIKPAKLNYDQKFDIVYGKMAGELPADENTAEKLLNKYFNDSAVFPVAAQKSISNMRGLITKIADQLGHYPTSFESSDPDNKFHGTNPILQYIIDFCDKNGSISENIVLGIAQACNRRILPTGVLTGEVQPEDPNRTNSIIWNKNLISFGEEEIIILITAERQILTAQKTTFDDWATAASSNSVENYNFHDYTITEIGGEYKAKFQFCRDMFDVAADCYAKSYKASAQTLDTIKFKHIQNIVSIFENFTGSSMVIIKQKKYNNNDVVNNLPSGVTREAAAGFICLLVASSGLPDMEDELTKAKTAAGDANISAAENLDLKLKYQLSKLLYKYKCIGRNNAGNSGYNSVDAILELLGADTLKATGSK